NFSTAENGRVHLYEMVKTASTRIAAYINDEVRPKSVTFIMHWCLPRLGDTLALDEAILFMTAYRFDSYEWSARMYRDLTISNIDECSVDLTIEPVGTAEREHPIAEFCKFLFQIIENDRLFSFTQNPRRECDIDSISEEVYAMKNTNAINQKVIYSISHETKFWKRLNEIFNNRSLNGRRIILTIMMRFAIGDFESNFHRFSSTSTTIHQNEYWCQAVENAHRDYKLICVDGELATSKYLLFLSSPHFRRRFHDEDNQSSECHLEFMCAAVKQILIFVYTEAFTLDTIHINYPYIRQLIAFGKYFHFSYLVDLKKRIEAQLCAHLYNHISEPKIIVDFLLLASNLDFPQLKRHCISGIVSQYYLAFKRKYNFNTENFNDREMFNVLNRGESIFSPSLIQKIDINYKLTKKINIVYNY
uniref:BTB domain-containing protein n=2 Tax=Parascaris univalens TaxID=6257 RepID=A0A915B7W0_PARUN